MAIPRGYRLRPVEAVQTWLAAARIVKGGGYRARCPYAAHSLRGGFLTSAAEAGASVFKLSEVSPTGTSRWTRCAATCAGWTTCRGGVSRPSMRMHRVDTDYAQ